MSHWFILDRDGNPSEADQLPERPEDARLDSGDAFTPWYKEDEHIHVESGKIQGVHLKAESLDEARNRLQHFLMKETLLISTFGGDEDILIPDAEQAIASK